VARGGKREGATRIIRRVEEEGAHGHHGGAWKVAYADFVTAMMAFFLMLWLLSTSSEETLKGLAEYFTDASANDGPPGGTAGVLNGSTLMPPEPIFDQPNPQPALTTPGRPSFDGSDDPQALGSPDQPVSINDPAPASSDPAVEATRAALMRAIEQTPELKPFEDSIVVERTPEGLRIQLLDREGYAMFPSGSAQMYPHTAALLRLVVDAVRRLPNRISIRGHTDSRPFAGGLYDNWALSSDRANATRRAMIRAGLPASRVMDVVGKGDFEHLFADPNDPRNRRISIVLLNTRPVSTAPT
jgi:chemotaxis protein MotB